MTGKIETLGYKSFNSDDEIEIVDASENLTNEQRIVKINGLLKGLNVSVRNVRNCAQIVDKKIENIEQAQKTRGWVISAAVVVILVIGAGLVIFGIVDLAQRERVGAVPLFFGMCIDTMGGWLLYKNLTKKDEELTSTLKTFHKLTKEVFSNEIEFRKCQSMNKLEALKASVADDPEMVKIAEENIQLFNKLGDDQQTTLQIPS